MSILHRYIAKAIIQASGLVFFAVLGVIFVIALLGELRDVGTGDYSFQHAFVHVLLLLPHDLYQFFPMLVLLGGVLGLGVLSSHSELIVMRASGVSMTKVIGAVISAALVLIVMASVVGECVGPVAAYLAEKHKQTAINGGQAVATASGVWMHEGNNFLHLDRVIGQHHLEGVKRYEFDANHHLLTVSYANTLDFKDGKWQFHDLVKTTFTKDRTISQRIVNGTWNLALNPSLFMVGMIEPQHLSLPKLSSYSAHLVENGLQAGRFQVAFWQRIFQPLTTLVMILLAVPFVFGSPRSTTMGWRILFGVIIGFVFYTLNAFLGQLSVVYQMSPWMAALLPTALFALVGYVLILKARN